LYKIDKINKNYLGNKNKEIVFLSKLKNRSFFSRFIGANKNYRAEV